MSQSQNFGSSSHGGTAGVSLPSKAFENGSRIAHDPPSSAAANTAGPLDGSEFDVVIVGAGIAGLAVAHSLRKKRFLLLEKEKRYGGNAADDAWENLHFTTAGAVCQVPDPSSPVVQFYKDAGLSDMWVEIGSNMAAFIERKFLLKETMSLSAYMMRKPWTLLDPTSLATFGKVFFSRQHLLALMKRDDDPLLAELFAYLGRFSPGKGKHPAIPWTADCGWSREEMAQFDSISLHDLFHNREVRSKLPPSMLPPKHLPQLVHEVIETALRVECVSEADVSAYCGLNFLVGYLLGEVIGFPGGNGGISRHLTELLWKEPTGALRAASPVQSIAPSANGDGYDVTFTGANGTETVRCRSVVYSAPKRTAVPVIKEMGAAQKAAIARLRYRSYYVTNVLFNRRLWPSIDGAYVIRNPGPANGELCSWCRTGAFMGSTWPGQNSPREVLTYLKPVARKEDTQRFERTSFEDVQAASYRETEQLLQTAGIGHGAVEDVRVWRWENAIIAPSIGDFRDGVFEAAGAPIGGIFFAGQDTSGLGNVESAVTSALVAADQVCRYLGNKA